jgi:hypothetical protein
MDSSPTQNRFLRRFLGCTAGGAAVVIFAKPLIILTVVVGVFATIGFLLWMPLRAVMVGPQRSWQSVCGQGRRWLNPMGQKCRRATTTLRAAVQRATPLVSHVLLEGVSGAVVALMLTVAAEAHTAKKSPVVLVAALSGAGAGSLLALAHRRRTGENTDTKAENDQGANLSSSQAPSSSNR